MAGTGGKESSAAELESIADKIPHLVGTVMEVAHNDPLFMRCIARVLGGRSVRLGWSTGASLVWAG
jgi:hypothetical protein